MIGLEDLESVAMIVVCLIVGFVPVIIAFLIYISEAARDGNDLTSMKVKK